MKGSKSTGSRVVHPNVIRMDYEKAHGYFVRIERGDVALRKMFSDSVYGRKARAMAIAWREEKVAGLPQEVHPHLQARPPGYSYVKRKISYRYSKATGEREGFDSYVGFLRIEDKKHLITEWSIDKWGANDALKRCYEWLALKKEELRRRLRTAGIKMIESSPVSTPVKVKPVATKPRPSKSLASKAKPKGKPVSKKIVRNAKKRRKRA